MTTIIDTLLPVLRLKLGDTDITAYRYLDEWLETSVIAAISALSRYWSDKYVIIDGDIARNAAYAYFETTTPVIQSKDAWLIILAAAIIVKSGSLENAAWDFSSWHDSELSFSNLESGRQKDISLTRDIQELQGYIKSPIKRPMGVVRTAFVEQ